jgi:hypothetical protein
LACVFPISVHDPLSSYISPTGPSLCKSADKIAQTEGQAISRTSVVCLERPETGINRVMYASTEELSQYLREQSLPDPSTMPANERMSSVSEQNDNNEEHRPRNIILRSLQRKLSWVPADDRSFRVAQSQELSSSAKHDEAQISQIAETTCSRCEGVSTGQFVQALGGMYHVACFTCEVCSLSFPQSL